MMKLLVASALLLSCLQAFQIYDAVLQTLPAHAKATAARLPQDINWPFDVCGDSDKWEIKSLTLTGQPARNTNDDITAVLPLLLRPENASMTSPWPTLT